MHLPAKVNSLFVQTFMANKIPSDSDGKVGSRVIAESEYGRVGTTMSRQARPGWVRQVGR